MSVDASTHVDMSVAVPVGRVADFPEGEFRVVTVNDVEVGVLRGDDAEWAAVRNFCPHRAAPICAGRVGGTMLPAQPGELVYGMEGKVVRCPWHGFEFDLETGTSVMGVTRGRLQIYAVAELDGVVYVMPRPAGRRA